MDKIPEWTYLRGFEFPMSMNSRSISDRRSILFPDLQNVTNFYRTSRRSVLEGWPVFRCMAAIDDMVQYIPA